GEIHALVGENGAGKSTLMHIVAGVYRADAGTIELDGSPMADIDERAAGDAGIAIVFQDRSLVPGLSIAENIFAARQPTNRFGVINRRILEQRTRQILDELQVQLDPGRLVGDLPPAQQQMVEIAKALSHRLRLLILDEPTAALTITESRQLFQVLRYLAGRGVGIVFVSHRLAEVFELAERVTVLKDGHLVGTKLASEVTPDDLIRMMVGRDLSFAPDPRRHASDAPVALEVQSLSADPVVDCSLTVRAGEIVCLAGLVGAGRTEVCEAIFGIRPVSAGRILVRGQPAAITHPIDAMRAGIGMVPEDRKEAGLFLEMSVTANIAAANLTALSNGPLLSDKRAADLAEEFVAQLRIATPDVRRRVMNLSGGNQQKVLLAKWLARKPTVLIVDEPTRGVDVGAKADIYAILRELAAQGVALLVVSSDLLEVLALAHKVVVMSERRVVGELDASQADEMTILRMAAPKRATAERGAA
nr:sugar ABC transporter ATP-binding protein [Chloroflexota bacterium]